MMARTTDIAGNNFYQKVFDIKYSQSPDQNRFSILLTTAEQNMQKSDYHNFEMIHDTLKDQPEPAKQLPNSIKIETTNPFGNKQNFEFENLKSKGCHFLLPIIWNFLQKFGILLIYRFAEDFC